MIRGSVFFSFLLLGICVACRAVDVPLQAGTPSSAIQRSETITPTVMIPLAIQPSETLTPTVMIPLSEDAIGMIAFYSHRDGNIEIYMMNPDGSDQRRVTLNEYGDDSPALSPDGSHIVFISNRDDLNPDTCEQNCFYQLYIVNSDGSSEHKLIETEFSTMHPDWHPDGTRISFDTEFDLEGDIYVVNSDGSDLHLTIKNGFWADWSPDGQQIVFVSKRDGNVELYLADANGNNQRRLTQNGRLEYFPDWSPDGQRIAFTVLQDRAIYVMDADGGNEQRLTRQSNAENPTWSPDGIWIAYQSSSDGDFEIYAINVEEALQGIDGFHPLQLTDNQVGDLWPSWRGVVHR